MSEPKSVLVTGATSGIGFATAQLFLERGYLVYCHGRDASSDFSLLDRFPLAKKLVVDLLSPDAISQIFAEIPKLDILVNNAGIIRRSSEKTPEDFAEMFSLHATLPYFCSLQAVKKGATNIVNVGSMRGLYHCATTPDYSASKAALHSLTASLARSLAPKVRVNAVAPGFTTTRMHEGKEARLLIEAKKTLLGRVADPREIAEAIFFLATGSSSFITGQILSVDGGRSFSEA